MQFFILSFQFSLHILKSQLYVFEFIPLAHFLFPVMSFKARQFYFLMTKLLFDFLSPFLKVLQSLLKAYCSLICLAVLFKNFTLKFPFNFKVMLFVILIFQCFHSKTLLQIHELLLKLLILHFQLVENASRYHQIVVFTHY